MTASPLKSLTGDCGPLKHHPFWPQLQFSSGVGTVGSVVAPLLSPWHLKHFRLLVLGSHG